MLLEEEDNMDQKLGGMLEELERVESKINSINSDIEEIEKLAVVKELKRKYKIREMLLHELKLLREQINGNCNHLWYYMGLENGIPVGMCLNCLSRGEIKEDDQVFQVINPTFNDISNEYSFAVLFEELHKANRTEKSRKEFVRKYQNNINKPIMQMVRDYPY